MNICRKIREVSKGKRVRNPITRGKIGFYFAFGRNRERRQGDISPSVPKVPSLLLESDKYFLLEDGSNLSLG